MMHRPKRRGSNFEVPEFFLPSFSQTGPPMTNVLGDGKTKHVIFRLIFFFTLFPPYVQQHCCLHGTGKLHACFSLTKNVYQR